MRVVIFLGEQESKALHTLAETEFRDARAQAALIIRQELERCGLLQTQVKSITPEPPANQGAQDVGK